MFSIYIYELGKDKEIIKGYKAAKVNETYQNLYI